MKKAITIFLIGFIMVNCTPKPKQISRGYHNPRGYHDNPPKSKSGPNSGLYLNK